MTRAETRAKNHALRRHVCDCTLEVQPRAYGALYSLLRAVRRGCFHPGTSLAWLWPEVSAIAASEEGEKGILKGLCPAESPAKGGKRQCGCGGLASACPQQADPSLPGALCA